jgi:uncharacterized membrane protein
MKMRRLMKHAMTNGWTSRNYFDDAALVRIESAIRESERRHSGELCFAYETGLSPLAILRGQTSRERALQVFSDLKVWDTENNNGVLLYLLLADRHVEIVADRQINRVLPEGEWDRISRNMSGFFSGNDFERGILSGIEAVTAHLIHHFPSAEGDINELSDRPVRL